MRLTFQPPCCLFAHHPSIPPLVSISSEVRVFSRNILIHKRAAKTFLISRRITFFVVIIIIFVILILIRFLSVLICLIFSVLSTIQDYAGFADQTLFWMVTKHFYFFKRRMKLFVWTVKIAMDSIGTKCMFQN